MSFDALILDSGEWLLSGEIPAAPWHVLIYRQRGAPENELHVWLPRRDGACRQRYAFKRYWEEDSTRWCVEIPEAPAPARGRFGARSVRFTAPDGRVYQTDGPRGCGLADLPDVELARLLRSARRTPVLSR